jgi:hypothetical protein
MPRETALKGLSRQASRMMIFVLAPASVILAVRRVRDTHSYATSPAMPTSALTGTI